MTAAAASRIAFNVFGAGQWGLHVTEPGTTADALQLPDLYLWDIRDLDGDVTMEVIAGTYTVEFSKAGFLTETIAVTLKESEKLANANVTLLVDPGPASVSGTTRDADGNSLLGGVMVTVSDGTTTVTTYTDADGNYTFGDLDPTLSYTISVDPDNNTLPAGLTQSADPDGTIVFVMNHRSNMDYILVAFLAAERTTLSYAVGEWARIWPLQTLIKSMGAFFVRRNSGNPLYRCVLERYVRDEPVLTLEEAIRKMTSFPAQRFGLADRGVLRPGDWADIVIFDLDRIRDRATNLYPHTYPFENYPHRYPEGIDYVLVNGISVIKEGEHTGALPGKVLRRRNVGIG